MAVSIARGAGESVTTGGSALEGDSALELTTAKYGCDEWWLLLDSAPVEE